nr:hypothetical protein REQ54_04759 [Rhizobium sp. Q54]
MAEREDEAIEQICFADKDPVEKIRDRFLKRYRASHMAPQQEKPFISAHLAKIRR